MHKSCGVLGKISGLLVIIGALNWGLVGGFEFNLVDWLFLELSDLAIVARVVYVLVGLAGLYSLVAMFTCKGCCEGKE